MTNCNNCDCGKYALKFCRKSHFNSKFNLGLEILSYLSISSIIFYKIKFMNNKRISC